DAGGGKSRMPSQSSRRAAAIHPGGRSPPSQTTARDAGAAPRKNRDAVRGGKPKTNNSSPALGGPFPRRTSAQWNTNPARKTAGRTLFTHRPRPRKYSVAITTTAIAWKDGAGQRDGKGTARELWRMEPDRKLKFTLAVAVNR